MCVCQQGMSDVDLPMIKRRRIDLGKESEFTIDLADEVSGLIGAHPMAPKLKRFLNNESLSVESMGTEGPEHLNL